MLQHVEAVYESGVLRPLSPIKLEDKQRVSVTIDDVGDAGLDLALIERARREVAAMKEVPSIEEVRALLSSISGSMSDAVMVERGER